MQSNQQKILFRWIMKNSSPALEKEVEVIELMYPVTLEEISVPVRNSGCKEGRLCVWPLGSLMQEVQEIIKGIEQQCSREDIINYQFFCKMCSQQTKFTKRSFHDFYYDRKLDYLIKVAKIKYFQNFKDQDNIENNEKLKARIAKNFKHSILYLYKGGGAVLEYKKILRMGEKVTCRAVVFQNTLSHYSEQLVFNPKDYARNLSALKLAQNLTQRRIGESIEKGFQETIGCYSKSYQQKLKKSLQETISGILIDNVQPTKKEELYAARMTFNQFILNQKTLELILFYPRYNLTQIYSFQKLQDLIKSCSKQGMKIVNLSNHQILLYTSQTTFIFQLESVKGSLHKSQTFKFNRPISILQNQKVEFELKTQQEVKYLKQWECYIKDSESHLNCDSVRPFIQSPIILVNPKNSEEIFAFGGTIQGISNQYVHKLERKPSLKWVPQKQLLKFQLPHCLPIIEMSRIYLLVFDLAKKKQNKFQLSILELQIIDGELQKKEIVPLEKIVQSKYLFPLRTKDYEYILVDLNGRQPPFCLNLNEFKIVTRRIKEDIRKLTKQQYDPRNQKSIFQSYPACSVTHNQMTYNLISHSLTKHIFKIFYGCDDEWLTSNLPQALIHD